MKHRVFRFVPAIWLLNLLLVTNPICAQLPAFPGAQGFGRFATGGRGGTVYFVTNLNDSGPGSFRDAVTNSGRTVIFRVGGVINYSGERYNIAPNVTIAGQTAPGDGVTLYGDGIGFTGSHNTITRFIRFRQGINGESDADTVSIANGHDMIFDHITASWGRDETFSMNGNVSDITIQSSIISQGLQTHSAGGLIQPSGGVSILRSLYIDNGTRNPKVKGINEFANNVVCNWETIGYIMGGDSEGEHFVNVFNNYFIRGQASSDNPIGDGNLDFHIYRANNWYDSNRNGILDGADLVIAKYGIHDAQASPYPYPTTPAAAYSPLTALKLAISDVGPSFRRDSVDERMITELISWGTLGGTITSELLPPMNGPGIIRNGTPSPDVDNDGMPDYWENGTGSNPSIANNNDLSPSGSGYTRLEDYLNWLAEPHGIALQNTNIVVDLRQFTRGWVVVNRNPVWSLSNPTNGSVSLLNGYFAQFTPTPGLNGPASFRFTVNDNDGGPVTRTMNLFFTPSAQGYQAVWRGDDLANNWNTLGDFNWTDGISLLYQFHTGEAVTFDDTGSTNLAVNLIGSLQPGSVFVDAKKNYTFSGGGSLMGSMALTKTNTGTLTINNTNPFTGNTTVSNGAVIVNGELRLSAVLVRNRGTIGGNGRLGNGLTVFSGGSLTPGNGNGFPGTLTITNGLTLSGGTTNRFDLSDDPSGGSKTNDVVRVIGDLNISGVNTIRVSLLDGLPGNGVYTLFTYTGTLNGSLANFAVSGVSGILTNPPGAIAILVDAQRPPATLTWLGDGSANIWDTGTNANWLNDGAPDRFLFLDDIVFDDSGSTTPSVNLIGEQTPNSVTVAADVNYTFSGPGKITGTTGLTKTNSGTLTLNTTNDFIGATVIGGGTLSAFRLANGGAASAIGAAAGDPANLQFYNSVLQYTGGSATSDRGATFASGSATFNIIGGGTTLTWNGTNVGSGSLVKSGPGTLILSAANTFTGGTIINEGTLALDGPAGGGTTTANNYALGSGGVTFQGGTLKLFGNAGSTGPEYGTFSRPLIVPAGETGTLLTPPRYGMSSSLSGGGTLNLEIDYLRGSLNGNWSAFTGLINITGRIADSEFRIANSAGYANASLFLNNNVVITRSGSAITIEIGTLGGTSGSRIGPGNQSSGGSSYRVGWRNENSVFAGQILADGVNTITKVGTGNWTLSGANSYSGGTIVDGGTLTVNNTSGSGTGTGNVSVNTGTTLTGNGTIGGAVTVASGATLRPGNAGIGTLSVNNNVTLNVGSTTRIEINKTSGAKDLLNALGTLTYGGTLIVTNLSGPLTNGDSFKIFDAGVFNGSFAGINLPQLASDLMWNTNTLNTSGAISVVSTNFIGPQLLTWVGDGSANVWDIGTTANWLGTNSLPRPYANGDTVTFNNSGSTTPAVNLTVPVTPVAMIVNASQDYTITGSGGLAGNMPLTKSGPGKLTLANIGANTFSGGTTISGGTLQIGNGVSANGTLTGNVTNNATLDYANASAVSSDAIIRGNGALVKDGVGTLTFTAVQPYTGPTTVNAGSITFNGAPPPSQITNNGSVTFIPTSAINYANVMSGSGALTINAAQTVTLSGPCTYSGGTTNISATLQIGNNSGAGSGVVVYTSGSVKVGAGVVVTNDFSIPSGATTDLSMDTYGNGTSVWAGNVVNLGTGASWRPGGTAGTLVFTGTANQGARNFIIPRGTVHIASNAVVSATGTATSFGRNGTGNSANVTVRNNAACSFGAFSFGGGQSGGGTLTLTIQDNASFSTGANNFDLHNSTAAAAVTVLNLNGGTLTTAGFVKTRTGATQFATNNFNGGLLKASAGNSSFLPALSGATCLMKSGGARIDDGGFSITISAPLLHDPALGSTSDGGLTKTGSGFLFLSGANTYTGSTTILAGRLDTLPGGAILGSIHIAPAGTFSVANNGTTTFTLGSGRMLSGSGSAIGRFTIASGAVLAPGSNSIGTLSFISSSSLTLAAGCTNLFEVSHAPLTNDVVKVNGAVTNGGTLIVSNLAGTLVAGDSFKLFDAASYSGSYSTVILPPLTPGLAWTNRLSADGTIAVISTAPANPPAFGSVTTDGNNLIMSGSNGAPNAGYYVLTSTNVALPMTGWSRVATNQFDVNGAFNLTNPINPATPQLFYRLQLP